jgi:putative protease
VPVKNISRLKKPDKKIAVAVKKPEIMAPAGSFESLRAAIDAGADSVYFGVQHLNMRSRSANNFCLEDLPKVAGICKKARIKSYITLNTLLYQHDLKLMRKIVDAAAEAGISAIIAQDMAAILYAHSRGMPVQASTQLSISNLESVRFYAQFVDTIVLARELDLKMIAEIIKGVREEDIRGPAGQPVKIEVFVHGALCIAQSGRCQMSLITSNTSAQRGACLQECRKKYRIVDEENGAEFQVQEGYVLSPKDLCALPFLDKLAAAGVDVLKIEGRGRSPEYVDTVVRVYREAVDAIAGGKFTAAKISAGMKRLESVYNRGFCDGYYLGKPLPDWTKSSGSHATEEKSHLGIVKHYYPKAGVAEIILQSTSLNSGDQLMIIGATSGVIRCTATEIMQDGQKIQSAQNPAEVTVPVAQRVRAGDKVYIINTRKVYI